MNLSSLQTRLSFQVKILVPVVTVMVLLFALAMWLVNHRISAQLHAQAAGELDTSRKIFVRLQQSEAQSLLAQYRHVVHEPRFLAVTRETDFRTAQSFLTETMHEL